jgi:hypothetical protein
MYSEAKVPKYMYHKEIDNMVIIGEYYGDQLVICWTTKLGQYSCHSENDEKCTVFVIINNIINIVSINTISFETHDNCTRVCK